MNAKLIFVLRSFAHAGWHGRTNSLRYKYWLFVCDYTYKLAYMTNTNIILILAYVIVQIATAYFIL